MKAEQFIKDYTNHCSNEIVFEDGSGSHLYEPWLTPEQALRAVEIAREEIYEWLQKISFDDYKVADEESYRMGCPYDYIDVYGLINNLKQAIKDSQYGR
jgi:hypothetical protein